MWVRQLCLGSYPRTVWALSTEINDSCLPSSLRIGELGARGMSFAECFGRIRVEGDLGGPLPGWTVPVSVDLTWPEVARTSREKNP
jgi:hypothetical protein